MKSAETEAVPPPKVGEPTPPLESPPLLQPPAPVAEKKIVLDETAVAPPLPAVAEGREAGQGAEPVTPVESEPESMRSGARCGCVGGGDGRGGQRAAGDESVRDVATLRIGWSTPSSTAAASRRRRPWPRRSSGWPQRSRRTAAGTRAALARASSWPC